MSTGAEESEEDEREAVSVFGLLLLMAMGCVLAVLYAYGRGQRQMLQSQAAYPSPEEGMLAFVANCYTALQKVELVRAEQALPWLDNL
nr:hypothetical protein [Chloroflexota bacterium]